MPDKGTTWDDIKESTSGGVGYCALRKKTSDGTWWLDRQTFGDTPTKCRERLFYNEENEDIIDSPSLMIVKVELKIV